MKIVRTTGHDLPLPKQETEGAAGYDLRCLYDFTLGARQQELVPTGFAIEIPKGFVAMVCPRSGLAAKHGITVLNAPGVIDSDFRGMLQVILINHSDVPKAFERGDRIAQLVIVPCITQPFVEVSDLDSTERGAGGLGSTGR